MVMLVLALLVIHILRNRIRCISRHGQIRRYFHAEVGVNGRIDTLQALYY